jgi:hypothetical protein
MPAGAFLLLIFKQPFSAVVEREFLTLATTLSSSSSKLKGIENAWP